MTPFTNEELIQQRKELAATCGEGIANAVFGFSENWLEGFRLIRVVVLKKEAPDGPGPKT